MVLWGKGSSLCALRGEYLSQICGGVLIVDLYCPKKTIDDDDVIGRFWSVRGWFNIMERDLL